MKGSRTKQRIILGIAFVIVLSGLCLLLGEMYKTIEPIKLFGSLNLGIVLIVVGGVLTFFAPKPPGAKKKRMY